jgi:adenylate kinase
MGPALPPSNPGDPIPNSCPGDPVPRADPGLEVKDARLIFSAVWDDLEEKYGRDHLRFPREFIWLGGAPGAGKGTNTPFIAKTRDITAPPIVISALLASPEAVAIKNAGKLVGDREVITFLFEELLKPVYHDGVIVDGFPRTHVQGECLQLFYHKLIELHAAYRGTPLAPYFRKPSFRIALLYVNEKVSVERQMKRGKEIRAHNKRVRATGEGQLLEERKTDTDPDLCRKRYQTFINETHAALKRLQNIFHFHFIEAEGPLEEVQRKIVAEFSYQSKLDLSEPVFGLIQNIPVARQLALHARQELVERLEGYAENNRPLFEKVIKLVEEKMIPIVRAHAMSGHARFNSEHELLSEGKDGEALKMLIDVFTERGFHASVDVHKMDVPERVDLTTGLITCRTKKVYRIAIRFPPSDIRRGH